jgi:uncharacterized protein YbjQ (UPF0145 family)
MEGEAIVTENNTQPLTPTFPAAPNAPVLGSRQDLSPRKVDPRQITTAFELPDCKIVRNLGIVRGLVVRSRSVIGNIGAAFQTLVGGNITLYTELCEKARGDAFRLMAEHAGDRGANAIIGMRYDANFAPDLLIPSSPHPLISSSPHLALARRGPANDMGMATMLTTVLQGDAFSFRP